VTPDTGVEQGGVVATHPGFNAVGSGGILDDPDFQFADFTAPDYKVMTISVTAGTMEYGFIVLLIDQGDEWCLSATEMRRNGNLRLRRCDFEGNPDYQLWTFDDQNRLRSAVDPARCMRVGLGSIFDGVRMRLGVCDQDYNKFELDDQNTQYLKVIGAGMGFCITNRGGSANVDDSIHAKPCPSQTLDDYQWEFYPVDV
jgi:hypothetical protein